MASRTIKEKDREILDASYSEILENYMDVQLGKRLKPLDAFFCYRILFGRNPDPELELGSILRDSRTFREFKECITNSQEFATNASFLPPGRLWMSEIHGFRFWFNTSDREMGVQMAMGSYEPRTVDLLTSLVQPGMRCIDAGAQTGFFSCLMAKLVGTGGTVYAFEPMPESYELLVKNVRENEFDGIVVTYNLACSDNNSTIEATLLSNMYVANATEPGEKVQMSGTRVGDLINDPIDIIKVDVEGHEVAALEGMRSIIDKSHPIILSEVNQYWLKTCSNSDGIDYIQYLNSLGYDVYDIGRLSEVMVAESEDFDILASIDILAMPKGHGPLTSFLPG